MTESINGTGACICGAVKITVEGVRNDIAACHCGTCRHWSGAPFFVTPAADKVSIEGEAKVSVFSSSEWAERGFCSVCGTHLFYRLKDSGDCHLSVGIFADAVPIHFNLQIFVDDKPEWYAFSNDTRMMTEADVFALYAPDND